VLVTFLGCRWVPLLFGGAATVLGVSHPLLDDAVLSGHPERQKASAFHTPDANSVLDVGDALNGCPNTLSPFVKKFDTTDTTAFPAMPWTGLNMCEAVAGLWLEARRWPGPSVGELLENFSTSFPLPICSLLNSLQIQISFLQQVGPGHRQHFTVRYPICCQWSTGGRVGSKIPCGVAQSDRRTDGWTAAQT
jgi:hypothetical protein